MEVKKKNSQRHILFFIGALLFFFFTFTGCDLERSSHGDLYGYWHLERIDSMNGNFIDMTDQLKFWAVQSKLIEMSDHDGKYEAIIFHFERQGDSLYLSDAHVSDRMQGDPVAEAVWQVEPFGVNSLTPRLRIVSLSSGKLILSNQIVRLNLKKF